MTRTQTITAVKRHADAQGYTVRQLCALSGVDYTTFFRWTKGSTPRASTVAKLLAVKK